MANDTISTQSTFRTIPNWERFFENHKEYLRKHVGLYAQGGTLDAIKDERNRLAPTMHPVTIQKTRGLSATRITELFAAHSVVTNMLHTLYPWTETHASGVSVPWKNVQLAFAQRISSFDSGQEHSVHFIASLSYAMRVLENVNALIVTQGTDSLVNKASLFSVTLSPYLYAAKKKIIIVGSAESGYVENSLAIANITGGLYAALETVLPGGVYIITAMREAKGTVVHILPGLGSVKLHADGIFYSPNTGSIMSMSGKRVYKYPLSDDLYERIKNIGLFPYLAKFYIKDSAMERLELAFNRVSIESVDNDPAMLYVHYQKGKRIFILRARGSGTASEYWREAVTKLMKKSDATVFVITSADRGDVNLVKYAAGLDIPGVISGRTLREESAVVLGTIAHDLRLHEGYTLGDIQQLVERYCYLSGMVGPDE